MGGAIPKDARARSGRADLNAFGEDHGRRHREGEEIAMATKAQKDLLETKRRAVVDRIKELAAQDYIVVGMLDERAIDMLALALGVGRVELND
jgi:hypothetical protein